MIITPIRSALIALRDCGVIRTRFDHPGYLALMDLGAADSSPVDGDNDALDWRLTDIGAAQLREISA